ncbi:MAG: zinc-binding dehydrogenase [Candidatus Methylomirabilia bacterium]
MKAALFHRYGDIDVLQYEGIDTPKPGPTEVLVKVRATALNYFDLLARSGAYKPNKSFPHILGGDIAGDVAEVGSEVTHVRPGDAVVVYAALGCGRCEQCVVGEVNCCAFDYRYVGAHLWGGYAEYVKLPAWNLVPLYEGASYEEAAAFNMAFLTSWHMLATRAKIRAGEDVLILAAGSGIGVAAVQIARLMGCRVFACVGSDGKAGRVRDLGADIVINYTKQDFRQEVMTITRKRGVDVVFEHTGKDTWDRAVRSLTRMGRLVTCGATSGYEATTNLVYIFHKQLTVLGSNHGTKRELQTLIKLLGAGKLRPIVDRVLPLKEAREGHRILQDRKVFGKVVLVPEH